MTPKTARPLKVITLNDKSDNIVRYDLFERLNAGGVALSAQEIRDCVYQGNFAKKLEELAKEADFKKLLRLYPMRDFSRRPWQPRALAVGEMVAGELARRSALDGAGQRNEDPLAATDLLISRGPDAEEPPLGAGH